MFRVVPAAKKYIRSSSLRVWDASLRPHTTNVRTRTHIYTRTPQAGEDYQRHSRLCMHRQAHHRRLLLHICRARDAPQRPGASLLGAQVAYKGGREEETEGEGEGDGGRGRERREGERRREAGKSGRQGGREGVMEREGLLRKQPLRREAALPDARSPPHSQGVRARACTNAAGARRCRLVGATILSPTGPR